MIDSNSIYIANILVMLGILVVGAVVGFFTAKGQMMAAKNGRQDKTITNQKELIETFEKKIAQMKEEHVAQMEQLQTQITALQTENTRLTGLIDDLMTMEDSRKRAAGRAKPQAGKITKAVTITKESE